MENIAVNSVNAAQGELLNDREWGISEPLPPEQHLSGALKEYVTRAESAFWNGQLGSARTGLRRLTDKIRAISDISPAALAKQREQWGVPEPV